LLTHIKDAVLSHSQVWDFPHARANMIHSVSAAAAAGAYAAGEHGGK